jgi:hypothetical protein
MRPLAGAPCASFLSLLFWFPRWPSLKYIIAEPRLPDGTLIQDDVGPREEPPMIPVRQSFADKIIESVNQLP